MRWILADVVRALGAVIAAQGPDTPSLRLRFGNRRSTSCLSVSMRRTRMSKRGAISPWDPIFRWFDDLIFLSRNT
ncbi:hypothetical protein [Burkholderia sp. BCC0419]|uniref:hypothetical protein n=1 Tax=Burkholderia sp. BCC0419 TaxID=486878 RepID=UPI001588DADB|nr:hypothetical protein [Burkholderia sp. BCC0419]